MDEAVLGVDGVSEVPKSLAQVVNEQAALLRLRRHRPILKVRMHSVDEAYIRGFVRADRHSEGLARIIGIPVEVDDSVTPGDPKVEYADE